jgi:putative tryptophan/tyrosine transport system substrate-binding protein
MKTKKSQSKYQRILVLITWLSVSCLLLSACGASKPKMYRVGILTDNANFAAIGIGFKAKMTELGYAEGKNIVYIEQPISSDPAELPSQAKALVDQKVDLIFAYPAPETAVAYKATQGTNIPVVCAYAQLDGTNMIKSVREPGGNLTGVRYPGPETVSKRLEIMLEIAPTVKRVWIGYDKKGPNTSIALGALRPLASSKGVTLVEVPATVKADLAADLAARANLVDIGVDAIIIMPDDFNASPDGFAVLSKFAADHKIPLAGGLPTMIQKGAVFANGPDLATIGKLAAASADNVLKGTPPGTIPVVTPDQNLYINNLTAQALGLTVPDGLLAQAIQIIH